MEFAGVRLQNQLFVAPMAGVTDRPFRQVCRNLGAGYAVSEMITSNALLYGTAKTRRRVDHTGESGPIAVQIAGADPHQMAEAARYNVANGAQVIDINMGCPAKKVCNVAAGSALMRDETIVARILEAVVAAVPEVPVTLKMRTGWDRESRNAVRIAQLAESSGIRLVTVHGRTRADLYTGEAEYDTIAAVKAGVSIPVIANGDIDSPQKAARVLACTGADGVMIGRGAQGRPWIFREIAHYLASGELMAGPTPLEVLEICRQHLVALYDFYGEVAGVRVARKHIAWYVKGYEGAHAVRQEINALEDIGEQLRTVERFFQLQAETSPQPSGCDQPSVKEAIAA
jgi:tRNA-dihydrouridine synthase B